MEETAGEGRGGFFFSFSFLFISSRLSTLYPPPKKKVLAPTDLSEYGGAVDKRSHTSRHIEGCGREEKGPSADVSTPRCQLFQIQHFSYRHAPEGDEVFVKEMT